MAFDVRSDDTLMSYPNQQHVHTIPKLLSERSHNIIGRAYPHVDLEAVAAVETQRRHARNRYIIHVQNPHPLVMQYPCLPKKPGDFESFTPRLDRTPTPSMLASHYALTIPILLKRNSVLRLLPSRILEPPHPSFPESLVERLPEADARFG